MRLKLKPILSILVLGTFLFMAFASEFLDESTNTEVQAEHCKEMPEVQGILTINIDYIDGDGDPVNSIAGTLLITHQLIADTATCQYSNSYSSITFHLDANGHATFTMPSSYSHVNEADLYRVEIKIPQSDFYEIDGFREVKVAAYNQNSLTFYKQDPTPL